MPGTPQLLRRAGCPTLPCAPRTPFPNAAAGALSGEAMQGVRAKVNALCRELASNGGALARVLCDGFGIPDHLLQAPIAVKGGAGWRAFEG